MPILEEYRRVLAELAGKRPVAAAESILGLIELHSSLVEKASFAQTVCEDPDDDKFLETAVSAAADYVVSGDKALLRVKQYGEIVIVQPSRFLKILSS